MSIAKGTIDETIEATQTDGAAPRGESDRALDGRELAQGDLVGRYVVLARLGAGAMGVVHAAYDPELDRKLAIKLLRVGHGGDHRRLLREAQAMARLGHPNVVAVHDVGEHDGRVFVAMEFVEGRTARAWVSDTQPSWPVVLDVFTQAGRGLQAAHEKGLVHRDFKPDNVMVGEVSDRVRVMDFGLARAGLLPSTDAEEQESAETSSRASLDMQLTHEGAMIGTPAYMAPEQLGSKESGPAADQFSFCVSLWEALYGCRPFAGTTVPELATRVFEGTIADAPSGTRVPRWLRRVLLRGLAVEPANRWPSMDALLVELSRGRVRARWRMAAGGVLAVALVAAGVLAWQQHESQQRIAACRDEGASIDAVWNDDARAALRDAIIASGAAHAQVTAEKLTPWLDAQAIAWAEASETACSNTTVEARAGWTADVHERARWCLDERRLELQALVVELGSGDPQAIPRAVPAAANLRRVEPCLDPDLLLRLPAPPDDRREAVHELLVELSRVSALTATGAYADGLERARATLAAAEAVQWPPLVATARVGVGTLLHESGRFAEAETTLEDAYFEAAEAGASEVAADAADELTVVVGYKLARKHDAIRWSQHAESHHAVVPDPGDLKLARHLTALAATHWTGGDHDAARPLAERALAIREETLGPEHPSVAQSLNAMAVMASAHGAYAESKVLHERALAIREKVLGAEHPEVAASLSNLGHNAVSVGDLEEARRLQERALAMRQKALGAEHPEVADSLADLAVVLRTLGEYDAALALQRRALAMREKLLGPEHPDVAEALINVANVEQNLGAYAEARPLYQRALAIQEKVLGVDHVGTARALSGLASNHKQAGELDEAFALYERAQAITEKTLGHEHPDVAGHLNNLATIEQVRGRPEEARALYQRALAINEKALGHDHADIALCLHNLGTVDWSMGDREAALASYRRALEIYERALGPDHPDLARTLMALAMVLTEDDKPREAVAPAERGLALLENRGVGGTQVAAARFVLARALWESDADRSRAIAIAEQARDGFRDGGPGGSVSLENVERWLAGHRGG